MFVAFTIHLHDLSHNLLHLHIGGMVRKLPLGHCLKFIDLLPERLLFNLNLKTRDKATSRSAWFSVPERSLNPHSNSCR